MSQNFICGGDKYTLGGHKGDTIALPVSLNGLPESIKVKGNVLLRKTTFHVSLVCIGRIVEKYNVTIADFVSKVIEDFCEFIRSQDVSLSRCLDEFRFVEEGERKSVVVMCEIINLNKFFDLINGKYNLKLEYQPTHVSLFTLQQDKAIFLIDSEDLGYLTTITPAPEGVSL